jgi:hypothetical protein
MCLQCFLAEKKTRAKKYRSRKGQYTGIRNTEKNVQVTARAMAAITFFHRLNSVMLRNAGLSVLFIVYGISTI